MTIIISLSPKRHLQMPCFVEQQSHTNDKDYWQILIVDSSCSVCKGKRASDTQTALFSLAKTLSCLIPRCSLVQMREVFSFTNPLPAPWCSLH